MDALRPYQLQALHAVERAAPHNCCAVLPCGAGKTKLGAAITRRVLDRNSAACVLVLCLRTEGVRQWAKELAAEWNINAFEASGNITLGRAQTLKSAQVVLVTYARMLSEQRRAVLKARDSDAGASSADGGIAQNGVVETVSGGSIAARFLEAPQGLLVADECHMVPAPKICDLLEILLGTGCQRRLVGLTGTLLREGGGTDPITDHTGAEVPWPLLGTCVHRETFAQLAPQYLAPVRCIEVRVPPAGKWRKLFARRPLASAVCLSRGKFEVLEHLLARHAQDSLLITVERCEQARLIASTFGIIPLDGSVSSVQMKDYLDRFRRRKIMAFVATHVLDDSADFPELNVVIQMGGFFASRRQEQQRLGRLLRWSPTKRQQWDETGARPTFYVLVHEGTVEERMSQHRTRSVIGVQYEQVSFPELTTSPQSLLEGTTLFHNATPNGWTLSDTLISYVKSAEDAAKAMEDQCFEMAKRTAANLPGGSRRGGKGNDNGDTVVADDRRALMATIRNWLHGSRIEEGGISNSLGDGSEDEFASDAMSAEEECGPEARSVFAPPDDANTRSAPVNDGGTNKKRRTLMHSSSCAASSSASSSSSSSSSSTSSASSSQKAPRSMRHGVKKKGQPRKMCRGALGYSAPLGASSASSAPRVELVARDERAARMQETDGSAVQASASQGSVQGGLAAPPGSDATAGHAAGHDASWGATTSRIVTHGRSVAVSHSTFAHLQGQRHDVTIDLD